MSIQPLIDSLEKITKLHQSLLTISEEKTECLKKGDIDKLSELLKQERKHAQAINQMETKRIQIVEEWAVSQGLNPAEITVSVMLEQYVDGQEKIALEKITVTLAETLVELKNQEQLNQQLTQQSLQFVEMSMNLIAPTIKTINYSDKGNKGKNDSVKRSVFDLKA